MNRVNFRTIFILLLAIFFGSGSLVVQPVRGAGFTAIQENQLEEAGRALMLQQDAGVIITPVQLNILEGDQASFAVRLATAPLFPVTILLASENPDLGFPDPASLTFSLVDWFIDQTVTVTVSEDDIDNPDVSFRILISIDSIDPVYSILSAGDITVTRLDDDTAGITVTPRDGLTTTEGGGTDSFEVVLNTEPISNVTIHLGVSDQSEGQVSPTSLTFDRFNWNIPQEVTVTGLDDFIADGDMPFLVITSPAVSDDPNDPYNGINAPDVSVVNEDDDQPGLNADPKDGLVTNEDGLKAVFDLFLDSQPTDSVTVYLESKDESEGVVSPTQITISPEDWNKRWTVTLTGVDDPSADGNQNYEIEARTESADNNYDRLVITVQATNSDNDTPGVTIDRRTGLVTSENGGTATFTVSLNTRPEADVRIRFTSSNPAEGVVDNPQTLIFTPDNWSTPQTVRVVGVDDPESVEPNDGHIGYSILPQPAESDDDDYDGLLLEPIEVVNRDNDGPRLEWVLPVLDHQAYNFSASQAPLTLEVTLLDSFDKTIGVQFLWWDAAANGGAGLYRELGIDNQPDSGTFIYKVQVDPKMLNPAWNQIFAIAYDTDGNDSQEKPFIWLYRLYQLFSPFIHGLRP